VAAQDEDPDSLLNRVRRLIDLRKKHPALCASGQFSVIFAEPGKYPFVYKRSTPQETILVGINPSKFAVEVVLPDGLISGEVKALYGRSHALELAGGKWVLRLPGISSGVYKI
jgi:maltose alpha-D-glucosyltransferase / alpha-amylase